MSCIAQSVKLVVKTEIRKYNSQCRQGIFSSPPYSEYMWSSTPLAECINGFYRRKVTEE